MPVAWSHHVVVVVVLSLCVLVVSVLTVSVVVWMCLSWPVSHVWVMKVVRVLVIHAVWSVVMLHVWFGIIVKCLWWLLVMVVCILWLVVILSIIVISGLVSTVT